MIAEDAEADIALARLALEEYGVLEDEVAVARDGEEALDYLYQRGPYSDRSQGNPGLVILDLKLPKITGLEILKEIRADAGKKDVPVVIFSSSLHEKDRADALQNGASAFFVKPMDFDTYCNCICSMLRLLAQNNGRQLDKAEPGEGPA